MPTAVAADPPASNEPRGARVRLTMPVVYATEAHSNVDNRLKDIARYLKHLRYTGFELLDTHQAELAPRGQQSFTLEGGRRVTVELLSRDEKRARVRVQVVAGKGSKLIDSTMWIGRNSTIIFAGPRYKDGILVLPLTARY